MIGSRFVLCLGLSSLLFASTPTLAAPRKPNVIFVLVDDLGYADVGAYGGTDIATPHIDRLAREGVKFTDFYANAPVCTPTRCAFITGRWQQRTGFEWALGLTGELKVRRGDQWVEVSNMLELGLPTTEPSIARLLKDSGYATGCVGKWHLGYKPEFSPNAHGFDEYFGNLLGLADFYAHTYVNGTRQMRENDKPIEVKGYLTDLYNAKAVEFIERHAAEPFFLYVPYNAVHFPFQPPDQPDSRMDPDHWYAGTRADYARMLERVDRGVGEMLAALEKAGILDDTLILFSSDNGGERLSDNRPLFNHKQSLWEGGIRVPCLLRWPKGLPRGVVTKQPAITMDLTATILSACGGSPPKISRRTASTCCRFCEASNRRSSVPSTGEYREDRHQKAVRQGKWKYVLDGALPMLFDLENDVSERFDVGFRHPEKLHELEALLAAWEAELAKTPPPVLVR